MKSSVLFLLLLVAHAVDAQANATGRERLSCRNPQTDMACMACNCYNEAGSQSYEGQVMVGKVVKTRMYVNELDRNRGGRGRRYASTVCGVIKQNKQFSWWNGVNRGRGSRDSVPAGHGCFRAAAESLNFRGYFADHYHANYVSPRWARNMRRVGDDRDRNNAGNGRGRGAYHIFYASAGMRQTPNLNDNGAQADTVASLD
jgi:spore germination cell wall hydrolase CwlJ-like protein